MTNIFQEPQLSTSPIAVYKLSAQSTESDENRLHLKRADSTRSNISNGSNQSQTLNLSESPLPQKRYTVDEALHSIGFGMFQRRVYVHSCISSTNTIIIYNTCISLIVCGGLWAANAAEIVILTFLLPILKDEWGLSQGINGIIGLSVFIGMLFGSMLWTNIGEKYGKVRAIKLCVTGQIIFGIICGIIPNIYWMVIVRLFVGICLGGYINMFTLLATCYVNIINN